MNPGPSTLLNRKDDSAWFLPIGGGAVHHICLRLRLSGICPRSFNIEFVDGFGWSVHPFFVHTRRFHPAASEVVVLPRRVCLLGQAIHIIDSDPLIHYDCGFVSPACGVWSTPFPIIHIDSF